MTDPADALLTLIDRQQVADVMSRYAAWIDEENLEQYRTLFDSDVELIGFGSSTIHGADAWLAFVAKTLDRFTATQHMLGPQLATIEGNRAEVRTDLQAVHFMKEPAGQIFTLWGTYQTQMLRESRDGAWTIRRHELVVRSRHFSPPA